MDQKKTKSDGRGIPAEIVLEILLRLPAVSLFRLRAVCKGWRSVIDDPLFIRAHTTNHQQLSSTFIFLSSTGHGPAFAALDYVDADELDDFSNNGPQTIPVTPLKLTRTGLSRHKALPVAACNGLLLFAPSHNTELGVWEIWNPLTQERLELPRLNTEKDLLGTGLGYDCASDDYKVVAVEANKYCQTHVYSLRWDSWRTVANYPTGDMFWAQNGVFLNGALHWLTGKGISVFDVATENYLQQLLPLPDIKWLGRDCQRLDVLGERLFLSCSSWVGRCWQFDLLVMNDYGAKDYTWTNLFRLETTGKCVLRPLAYMKQKRQVLLQDDGEFVWFDEKSVRAKSFQFRGISENDYSSQACVGSLVRLHDRCRRVASKIHTDSDPDSDFYSHYSS